MCSASLSVRATSLPPTPITASFSSSSHAASGHPGAPLRKLPVGQLGLAVQAPVLHLANVVLALRLAHPLAPRLELGPVLPDVGRAESLRDVLSGGPAVAVILEGIGTRLVEGVVVRRRVLGARLSFLSVRKAAAGASEGEGAQAQGQAPTPHVL